MMNLFKRQSGIGLLVMVALIAIAGIAVTAASRSFMSMSRQTHLRINQAKAHYLAQAGVMRVIYNWYTNNTTTEGSRRITTVNTTVTGNTLFKAGLTSAGVYLQSNFAYVAPVSHTGITHVQTLGTASSKTAGTTLARTLTVATTQGDFVVVYFAMDDAAGAVTCADTAGNTYQIAADVSNSGNVRTVILYAIHETALAIGNTITVTHPNVTARAMAIRQFRGPTHLDTAITATGNAPSQPSSGNIARNERHELLVGANGGEGPNTYTFTQGAGWTTATLIGTSGGVADTNITMHPQYRIQNDNADYAAGGTISTAVDWASAGAAFIGCVHWYTPPATSNRRLRAWRVQNINSANSITITNMKVSWTGGGLAQLTDIRLNNTSVWSGAGSSGTDFDVTDTALTTGSSWSGINTYLQWNNSGPADPTTVTIQMTFSGNSATTDAKTSEIVLWDGAHAGGGLPFQRTFTVTSTGQVNQTLGPNNFKVLKTVKAEVSGHPGLTSIEITDWDEGEKNIP